MKKNNDLLREYAKRLNDDDLKHVSMRLGQRLGGDVGEALELVQRYQDMDRWLSSATDADDFFDMIDQIDFHVQQEVKKRFGGYEQKEKQTKAAGVSASR